MSEGRRLASAIVFLSILLPSLLAVSAAGETSAYPPIEFDATPQAIPYDLEPDSMYDVLAISAGVRIIDPGRYTIVAKVFQTYGEWMAQDSVKTYQSPGSYVYLIEINGGDIYDDHLNGTYQVELGLYPEVISNSTVPIATLKFTAGNFTYDQFVPWGHFSNPSHLEGLGEDQAVDIDGDGLYEQLVVRTDVHAMVAGSYGLEIWIGSVMDNITGPATYILNLTEGVHTVEVTFSGELFVNTIYDGPYRLYMGLMDVNFSTYYSIREYWTGNYTPSQFSGTAPAWLNGISHYPVDVTGDGALEYLAIDVNVTVTVPGIYSVSGDLSDTANVWSSTYLDAGEWTVSLLYPAVIFATTDYLDSYMFDITLSNETGHVLWSCAHTLPYYDWVIFSEWPVAVVKATPTDGNDSGNYSLSVSSSVVVGPYEVRWDFNGDGIWDTNWSSDQSIEHQFPGPGNYTVIVELRDSRGNTNQTVIIVTVEHKAEPPPSGRIVGTSLLPQVLISVTVFVSVCIAVILLAWPVEFLLVGLIAFLLPLYSRLRNDDVLDNYRRGMIHGLLLAHPGITFSDLRESLSISNGSLVYHLHILEDKGIVCCRKSGSTMRYYLNGSPLSKLVRLGLTKFQMDIVRHVLSKGEATASDIRIATTVSKQTLHYNLKKLVTDGILVRVHSGAHRAYRIAPEAKEDLSTVLTGHGTTSLLDGIRIEQESRG